MNSTIPKKALVALPDFLDHPQIATTRKFVIVPPEKALVPAFDRSFHFGDSLYEVTRSYDGILFSLGEHMHRLEKSAELAAFETRLDTDLIVQMVRETCRTFFTKFGNTDVYVRITVSRGIGDLNIDRSCSSEPYPVVFVKALEPFPAQHYDQGVHYAVVSRRRNHPAALDPAMKSGNYLNNVLALAEAKKLGASDAIMLSHNGFVTEGTTNNVHMVKNGEVWTAPLSVGILAGITRDWIFEIGRREGIEIQERLYTEADLQAADELFLSSATKEVMPITKLNGHSVGDGKPGPVTKKLHQGMKQIIQEYSAKHRAESLYL